MVIAWNNEDSFRREHPTVWWLTLVGPFIATAGILLFVLKLSGANILWRLVTTAVATFFVLGKFVILGGSEGDLFDAGAFFTAEQLAVIGLYMDMMTACVMTFHLGFLSKLPAIGAKLNDLAEDGRFILQSNVWMKRATFAGLVDFVMFPLAAIACWG